MFSCLLGLYDKSNKTNKMTSAAEVEYLEKNSPSRVDLITLYFVLYFVVGQENHASLGGHYHVSIHLKSPHRGLSAKKIISKTYNAIVIFVKSSSGGMYASAYRYLCK